MQNTNLRDILLSIRYWSCETPLPSCCRLVFNGNGNGNVVQVVPRIL